jgi:hypothetical protein
MCLELNIPRGERADHPSTMLQQTTQKAEPGMHQCLSCTLKGFLSLLMCRRKSERTFLHHLLHGLVGFLILVDTEDYEVVCLVLKEA